MGSLNEYVGDGKTVDLPESPLTEMEDIGVLLNMSQSEIDTLSKMQEKLVSQKCASEICKKKTRKTVNRDIYICKKA